MKYHFIRELVEYGILDFIYCDTNDMIADMMTKPLNKKRLSRLSKMCRCYAFVKDDDQANAIFSSGSVGNMEYLAVNVL